MISLSEQFKVTHLYGDFVSLFNVIMAKTICSSDFMGS